MEGNGGSVIIPDTKVGELTSRIGRIWQVGAELESDLAILRALIPCSMAGGGIFLDRGDRPATAQSRRAVSAGRTIRWPTRQSRRERTARLKTMTCAGHRKAKVLQHLLRQLHRTPVEA